MRYRYLNRSSNGELILFFTGWGMSPETVEHLTTDSTVVVFYDYTSISTDFPFEAVFKMYERIHLIAWSFGVWSAWRTMLPYRGGLSESIAVNGTLKPVDRDFGIPPEIFKLTLDSLSQTSMQTFIKRMCRDENTHSRFAGISAPVRSTESLKTELEAINKDIELNPADKYISLFKNALIGTKDVIIPYRNQLNWWKDKIYIEEKQVPHFPFFEWESWTAMIKDVTR